MNKNYNIELFPDEIIQTMRKSIYYNYLYFKSYSDINKDYLSIRNALFSLIHKVSNKMNFKSNTYFLSAYFLDLIFLKNKIPYIYNNNFELLGLSCLVLAAKHLENDPTVPHLQYFVSAYNYTVKQIKNASQMSNVYDFKKVAFNDLMITEVIVLKMLNYKLNYFTIYDFNSFFFGHGILKIEQLKDISEDFYSKKNNNFIGMDDDLNYINPSMVKKILEKIYKKSRFYLDNVVKSKISLKYDSFVISIYIMYKSVEYVILKESKLLNDSKDEDKYFKEKREENLKRKTSKCYKSIINEIYKIDLDSLEEYQYLINDDDFLKIFYPLKYGNNNNIRNINNVDNKFDINKRMEKFYNKMQSNDLISENNKSIQESENNQKKENKEDKESKEFSPKKLSKIKVPLEKYNKIRKFKIMEKLSKNNTNKFTKSFIRMNSNNKTPDKINNSISNQHNKDILSKSNINVDFNDIKFYKSNKLINRVKKLHINNPNDKLIEPYSGINNFIKFHKNTTSKISTSNPKETIKHEHYFTTITAENERENKIYKNELNINNNTINHESYSNKELINLKGKFNKEIPSKAIKPYSKKVIPKFEQKSKNTIGQNFTKNPNKKFYNNVNTEVSINNSINNNIIYKDRNYNEFDLRKSNDNKFKKSYNNIDNKINDSIKNKENLIEKYSSSINSNNNYATININMLKNSIDETSSNNFGKFRGIPLLKSDYKKLSMSVNKIKVFGVSNKHKLNKKLIYGMNKTPMKTQNHLKNALNRNLGVKRNSNNNNLSVGEDNSLDNSIEEKYKDSKKSKNIDNKVVHKKDYSCINLAKENLTINNSDNDNFSNKKLINLKNNIVSEKYKTINHNNNKSIDFLYRNNNKNELLSSSSEEDDENDEEENDNITKKNNVTIKIDKSEDNFGNFLTEKDKNNIKCKHAKRYKIKKIFDNNHKGKSKTEKSNPKIELIQINKRKTPTIVINNNINVNFDNKGIGVPSKFKNFKIK